MRRWILLVLLALLLLAVGETAVRSPAPVRGKTPARPLLDIGSAAQQLAHDLALGDPQVQALTLGTDAEVFGIREVGAQFTARSAVCAVVDCFQVEIYSFADNATTSVIIDLAAERVLDVLYQPGLQPGISPQLAERALTIALNDPLVIAELGFRPQRVDMAPVGAGLEGTACQTGHLCVAPTFRVGNQVLWAVVDLTAEKLAGVNWTSVADDGPHETLGAGDGCPAPGSVSQDGWEVQYETTGSDGLRVYDVTFGGREVLRSAKLVEWHVDYNGTYVFSGFQDVTGCSAASDHGYPIQPYGETALLPLTGAGGVQTVGFELVQDFRMNSWGAACNYRYEQRMQFYQDGSFRLVTGAYGRGCGEYPVYRPVLRIDIAVDGDAGDLFATWDGAQWQPHAVETIQLPPDQVSPDGYSAWVMDSGGAGYYLEPGRGQFGDGGRGDAPFLYATQHNPAEGDTDLPTFSSGYCCNDDERQGPELFVNGESLQGENLVLWYVGQHQTDVPAESADYYCWTVAGEPNPETYPCFGGPLFVPFGFDSTGEIVADFSVAETTIRLPEAAQFNDHSNVPAGEIPLNFTWEFGDGGEAYGAGDQLYRYLTASVYTPTLTIDGFARGVVTAVGPPLTVAGSNQFLPQITRPALGFISPGAE